MGRRWGDTGGEEACGRLPEGLELQRQDGLHATWWTEGKPAKKKKKNPTLLLHRQ